MIWSHSLNPHEGVIKLRIYWLQIDECQRFVEHSFVKWQRETSVDELAVEKSLRDKNNGILIFIFYNRPLQLLRKFFLNAMMKKN